MDPVRKDKQGCGGLEHERGQKSVVSDLHDFSSYWDGRYQGHRPYLLRTWDGTFFRVTKEVENNPGEGTNGAKPLTG